MRNPGFLWIIIGIMVVLDFYVFQAVKVVSQSASHKTKLIIYSIYWTISATTILLLILLPYVNYDHWPRMVRTYLFAIVVGLFFQRLFPFSFFWQTISAGCCNGHREKFSSAIPKRKILAVMVLADPFS